MYRIGVDVGGTNTDAAILDINALDSDSRGVLATCKTATTAHVTLGIQTAVKEVLAHSNVDRRKVLNVAIGTTHFVNAVVENDARRLGRVAVVRLCGPYTRKVYRRRINPWGVWLTQYYRYLLSLTSLMR
jgi:N-methylhydantoinase A/oxoprolinase/acetone carboxylase beta subunit